MDRPDNDAKETQGASSAGTTSDASEEKAPGKASSTAPTEDISDSQEEVGASKDGDGTPAPAAHSDVALSSPSAHPEALLLLLQGQTARAPSSSTSGLSLPPSLFGGLSNTSMTPSALRSPHLHQMQAAMQAQGTAGLHQGSQPQRAPQPPAAPSSQMSILEHLAAAAQPSLRAASSSSSAQLDSYLQHQLAGQQRGNAQRSSLEASLLQQLGGPSQLSSLMGLQPEPHPPLPASLQLQLSLLARNESQILLRGLLQQNALTTQMISTLLLQQQQHQQPNVATAETTTPGASLGSLLQQAPTSNSEDASHGTNQAAASTSTPQQPSEESKSTSPAQEAPSLGFMANIAAADMAAREQLEGPKKAKEKRWLMKYEELKQFRQVHGHCRVPHSYSENRKLTWWVMNQRAQYQSLKHGKKTWLTEERVRLLDAIDFDWSPGGTSKSSKTKR